MEYKTLCTQKHAYDIFTSRIPGLFKLNNLGGYGYYTKYEVIFADLCQLFGFIIYVNNENEQDYKFNKVLSDQSIELIDVVDIYPYEQLVSSSIELKRIS